MPFYKCFPCLKFQNDEVITKLDFSNTALTDVFPDVWQHERTLEELILTSTRINSLPPQLFYCQGLRSLAVNNNGLESIPNAVGSLRQLQHLNLGRNLISNVPENIKTCKNLTHLDLSCNNLQRLPDAITCLISLQELLLNETYLEFLPANFGRLVNLHILELRLNNLITLPKSMARLNQLQRIDIGGNEFTELPEVIGELKNLRELWIDFNQIRRISPNIANLRELRHFEANGNLIETLPNEISHWRNIEVFSVCSNNLESLPFSIGMMKSLVTFKCESNQLRELPDSICNLEHLEELVISHNQLLRLPTTIGMLRKLRYLFVDGNDLRILPDEICNCGNLSVLSVSRNKISELPQNIGHLSKLKVLNLVNNFIATLPVSMLSLVNLTSLWLSDNQSQPLVPLQYLDMNTKTQLTCFMLPQGGGQRLQQQQYFENEFNTDDNSIFFIQQQQQNANHQQQQLYELESQKYTDADDMQVCASPSRRICFAEEATIMTSSTSQSAQQQPSPKVVSNDASTQSMPEEPLATRLMRSPTPYPKELRLMAKYVRNSQKVLTQKHPESVNVKEAARVLSNSYCDAAISANTSRPIETEQTQLANSTNTELQQQQLIHSGSIRSVNSYDHNIAINNNAFNQTQQQQQVAIHCAIPQIISYNPSLQNNDNAMQQYYTAYCAPPNLSNSLYDDAAQHAYYLEQQQQQLYPQQYALATNYDMQALVFQQQQQRANNLMEPPPYHIARVFTKKSPEDLTNYDTLRTQQQQLLYADDAFQLNEGLYLQQQQEVNAEREMIKINDATLLNLTNVRMQETKIDEVDASELNSNSNYMHIAVNSNFDHQNNLAAHSNAASAIETLSPLLGSKSTEKLCNSNETISGQTTTTAATAAVKRKDVNCQLQNGIVHSVDQLVENNHSANGNINNPNSCYQNLNNSKSKTPWLFGVHKNPTVKQVTIRWEQIVGFEIEQRQNKDGIFVSATIPNTTAANLLCPHDKLLEVDGYDFTSITLAEAKQILADANPILNIMLSRK